MFLTIKLEAIKDTRETTNIPFESAKRTHGLLLTMAALLEVYDIQDGMEHFAM